MPVGTSTVTSDHDKFTRNRENTDKTTAVIDLYVYVHMDASSSPDTQSTLLAQYQSRVPTIVPIVYGHLH